MAKTDKRTNKLNKTKKTRLRRTRGVDNSVLAVINPVSDAKESLTTGLKFLTSALTLVAALAWNEAIKSLLAATLDKWLPNAGEVLGKVIYAVIITIITVYIINRLKKVQERFETEEEESQE